MLRLAVFVSCFFFTKKMLLNKHAHHLKTRSAAMQRNQVFNDSTKYWCDRNKKWKMAVKKKWCCYFGCIGLSLPSLVSIGQSKLKLLSGNWISIFSNSDIDLDHRHLGSKLKLRLDVSYPYSKFGVNKPKQTKVFEQKPKVDACMPPTSALQ